MTLGFAESGRATCIDFNSLSPAALAERRLRSRSNGVVPGKINQFGWLAAIAQRRQPGDIKQGRAVVDLLPLERALDTHASIRLRLVSWVRPV